MPVLAARAALGGRLDVSGAGELRVKESDRISALVSGLARRSASTPTSVPTAFSIDGIAPAAGGTADAAATIASSWRLRSSGWAHRPRRVIDGADVVAVSYPGLRARPGGARRVTTDKIYLVGFMASGKSTIARALAARLRWRSEDVDDLIEARERRTIAEIFAQQRRAVLPHRRTRDPELLKPMRNVVVATGGGTFADPENRSFINFDGVSVWIDLPLADLIPRIPLDGRRPLAANRAQLERLYASRVDTYRLAHVRVSAAQCADLRDRRSRPRGDSRSCRRSSSSRRRTSDLVRYLIISDIHANLHALDAVLADADAIGYDAVLVLGDLVGYGADPERVIARTLALEPVAMIRGNHDKVCAGLEPASLFNDVARAVDRVDRGGAVIGEQPQVLAELPKGPAS